jgi:D-proline reductase (dithiol) PrdB
LTARTLEAAGIATVIIGNALDIVTFCGVPRFYYNDLPLGNPLGRPFDAAAQMQSVRTALALIDSAIQPVVVESELTWSTDEAWKSNYMKIDASNRESLRQKGEANRAKRQALKEQGQRRL